MPNGDAPTATNPKTGEKVQFNGSQWVPIAGSKKPESTAIKVGRGAFLGTMSGLGIPESQHPVKDFASNIGGAVKSVLMDPLNVGKIVEGMATGVEKSGREAYEGYKQHDPEMMAHGATATITSLLAMKGAKDVEGIASHVPEDPAVISESSKGMATKALQSIVNRGPTHEKMQMLQDADALATKAKLATVEKAVKDDASGLMNTVSKTVDEKIPEGSVDGGAVGKSLKADLGSLVKARTLRNKLPPSVQKILEESEGTAAHKTTGRLSDTELRSALAMKKSGLKGDDLSSALTNLGFAPKQADAIMAAIEGSEAKPSMWGFEKAKQLRTELADELFTGKADNYPGPVKRAMNNAWGNLTKSMDTAAEKAGVGEEWSRAREKFKNYYSDFYGTYDRGHYNQSPLSKSLSGVNGKGIMEPLSGESAQLSRDILRKYKQFGVDPQDIMRDVRRYTTNQKIMKFADPSKWDIIIGGMALYRPEFGIPAFIARYGVPRLAEKIASRRAAGMEAARPATSVVPEPPPTPR